MQRRYNLANFILASVVALVLATLIVVVEAQAQIAFMSKRDGRLNPEIYVMDADGKNQQRLTENRHDDWDPSWSPNGKRIVFFSNRDGHVMGGIPTFEIYVMDADGGNQQRLTNHPNDDRSPSWSPNGKRIAFVSNRDGHVIGGIPTFEIYVMDADGKNQQRLTNNPDGDWNPSWSPDGKRIVFRSNRDGHVHFIHGLPTYEIYVMDADGGNQQRLTNNPNDDRSPSWSPHGKRIVFVSDRDRFKNDDLVITYEIYVMDADGGNPQNLTNDLNDDYTPSWSPDGKRIAFVSERDGHVIDGWPTNEIYVMDADGGNQQNLTNNPHYDMSPSWSPDGKRIVFQSDREEPLRDVDIYVMDADGKNPQNLTNNPNSDWHPSWSPDGKRIVFSARRDGKFEIATTHEIYVMDADGGNQQRLTENRQNDWFPSWSPDGKRIAFASDRKGEFENFEIYVMDADGGNQQRLTNNRVWDMDPSWSPDGKRIAFASDRKGDLENFEIYVMDADGGNQKNLTNNRNGDGAPAWFNSPFSVSAAGKKFTLWGWIKQVER